jgi:hypothetical protein
MHSFDPTRLGGHEATAWVAYYKRQWGPFLRAAIGLTHGESFDVDEAARLEVEWWRAHRYLQRDNPSAGLGALTDALAALYAHVYGVLETDVREAAASRAEAMRISDQWVEDGCDPSSPAIARERAELIRGYEALRKAVAA